MIQGICYICNKLSICLNQIFKNIDSKGENNAHLGCI